MAQVKDTTKLERLLFQFMGMADPMIRYTKLRKFKKAIKRDTVCRLC